MFHESEGRVSFIGGLVFFFAHFKEFGVIFNDRTNLNLYLHALAFQLSYVTVKLGQPLMGPV
jgi:hypothetical protein